MGARWIKAAVIYFLIGVGFGLYMHATIQLQWGATHAHINVVGWLTTAMIGIIYTIYPQAGNSILGKVHFWLYNIGLPVLLIGMFIIQPALGLPMVWIQLCIWAGGSALAISILLFIVNVFKNVHAPFRTS
ncbi:MULTISPECIES: hypothetical protein [unclassified Sporosarcina]|uniref:hypothetical protein n=1 Tax=unclassified Sporosarcina TaxID=2647733 RepID=UPI000C17190E|nr:MULTISPECIES: hypothetical protein [unclassified Sporosarcina]PID07073.1 hypothetical protein CSV66_00365 [Sporosarcina sp. P30]PID10269.1 hypothetical protein CSV65_00370 [Sporosarcina sp. P31]PID12167.1 hypothetical protein CSV64_08365 [Sporosarcina sp. P32b]